MTDPADNLPRDPVRKRATDDHRTAIVDELSAAVARGQLTLEEFGERSAQAWSARFVDELRALVEDVIDVPPHLPVPPPPSTAPTLPHHPDPASRAVAHVRSQITGQQNGSALSLSFMGGSERRGNWICPTTHTTISVMGGNVVDLRDALLESDHITITAFTLMGGIEIIVPEGVRVICDGMGLLGGFGSETHKSVTIHPSNLPGNAPVVRVRGLAVMGGVAVVTRARG